MSGWRDYEFLQLRLTPKLRESRFWERRRPKHLLSDLVTCACCESPFAAVGRDYLACGAARRQGTCSNRRSIRRSALETLILDGLRHHLMRSDLVETFITAFHEEVNRHAPDRDAGIAARRKELDQVSRRLDALIEAIADGFRSDGLQAKLTALESRKKALEQDLGVHRRRHRGFIPTSPVSLPPQARAAARSARRPCGAGRGARYSPQPDRAGDHAPQ